MSPAKRQKNKQESTITSKVLGLETGLVEK